MYQMWDEHYIQSMYKDTELAEQIDNDFVQLQKTWRKELRSKTVKTQKIEKSMVLTTRQNTVSFSIAEIQNSLDGQNRFKESMSLTEDKLPFPGNKVPPLFQSLYCQQDELQVPPRVIQPFDKRCFRMFDLDARQPTVQRVRKPIKFNISRSVNIKNPVDKKARRSKSQPQKIKSESKVTNLETNQPQKKKRKKKNRSNSLTQSSKAEKNQKSQCCMPQQNKQTCSIQ